MEDNLSALGILDGEPYVQAKAVTAADKALSLTINHYKAGAISYLNVMTAQMAAFERLSQVHYAFKSLAYTLINLRHYCQAQAQGIALGFTSAHRTPCFRWMPKYLHWKQTLPQSVSLSSFIASYFSFWHCRSADAKFY